MKTRHLFLMVLVCFSLLATSVAWAGFSVTEAAAEKVSVEAQGMVQDEPQGLKVFGWNLFQGNFSKIREPWYNPAYRIHIGDMVNVKIWGAVELAMDVPVDSQGNIFLPKVGNVPVLGVKNEELIATIEKSVKRVYLDKVQVYANVANYQPITVFVAGNVRKPGLYQGMASDSILQYLDKAGGIVPEFGSYRNIDIVRDNRVVKRVDLYPFLTKGATISHQFQSGDVISVKPARYRVRVTGDVMRPYAFELAREQVGLDEVMRFALPNPTATNVVVKKWVGNREEVQAAPLYKATGDFQPLTVASGQVVEVLQDVNADRIQVEITGEHDSLHTVYVPRGTTLGKVLPVDKIRANADIRSIQLFRKSIADKQKQLLLSNLEELEKRILTMPSLSKDESILRSNENQSILAFIDRARKVQPKGQVVINEKTNLDTLPLEDGDRIHIPSLSSLVLLQGEVAFPGAHTQVDGYSISDYVELSGGLGPRADKKSILLIKRNGRVCKLSGTRAMSRETMEGGESLLVLPKVEVKHLQLTKDITQILYQVAVAAKVLVTL